MNHALASAEPPTSSGSTILKKNSFFVFARRTANVWTTSGGLTLGRLAPIAAIATIRHTLPMDVNAVSHALVAGNIGSTSSPSTGINSAHPEYGTHPRPITRRVR